MGFLGISYYRLLSGSQNLLTGSLKALFGLFKVRATLNCVYANIIRALFFVFEI